jgi:hypothetical protein
MTGLSVEEVSEMLEQLTALGAIEAESGTISRDPHKGSFESLNAGLPLEERVFEAEETPASAEGGGGTHRKLFESSLHALTADARVSLASRAEEPELSALCFDPLPQVIRALLENQRVGLTQARLIARHHHHPVGLEALATRAAFAADAVVRRSLAQNAQTPIGVHRRLWQSRRLTEQYQLVISKEVSEAAKTTGREVLRARFATGPAEERVELIMKTEGRCLTHLAGLPIDGRTTALLCGRTFGSTLFVQNLARWSAAPPALVAHLLRQEVVRRSPQLRTMLERHPNAP